MRMFCSLLGRKFSSNCKHSVKCIKCRMEMSRKRNQAMVRFLKKVVADHISGGRETIAFGRMDELIVEINQAFCYDMIEQYCCCILEHLPTMQKERVCPEETVEAIATLIFAAARFPDLPELADLRKEFKKRYGTYMEGYINEEFVEKMQKKSFPQDKKLRLMQDITQEFSIHWDSKAFEYKISNPSAPTSDQPKIQFASSNENIKLTVLKKEENVQKKQLKSEELINTENIKEYQSITQMKRYGGHHPYGSTEKIKNVETDELRNAESHQLDVKAPLNLKTKERNTCKRSESVHERLGSVGTEWQRAGSMDYRDAKAVNTTPPYTKFSRDITSTNNQDNFAHSATSEVAKEMDHNVQGSQPNRTMNPQSTRAFNLKPPYVKPKVTKSTSAETGYAKLTNYEMSNGANYLTNAPFSIGNTATNAEFTVEDGQIPIKQVGKVGKKNSMHGDGNDQQSSISPLSDQTEDDATNGAVYRLWTPPLATSSQRPTKTLQQAEMMNSVHALGSTLSNFLSYAYEGKETAPSLEVFAGSVSSCIRLS